MTQVSATICKHQLTKTMSAAWAKTRTGIRLGGSCFGVPSHCLTSLASHHPTHKGKKRNNDISRAQSYYPESGTKKTWLLRPSQLKSQPSDLAQV